VDSRFGLVYHWRLVVPSFLLLFDFVRTLPPTWILHCFCSKIHFFTSWVLRMSFKRRLSYSLSPSRRCSSSTSFSWVRPFRTFVQPKPASHFSLSLHQVRLLELLSIRHQKRLHCITWFMLVKVLSVSSIDIHKSRLLRRRRASQLSCVNLCLRWTLLIFFCLRLVVFDDGHTLDSLLVARCVGWILWWWWWTWRSLSASILNMLWCPCVRLNLGFSASTSWPGFLMPYLLHDLNVVLSNQIL